MVITASPAAKPLLRGASHQGAFFAVLGGGAMLVADAGGIRSTFAVAVYVICLALMFGTSALYHRADWSPDSRLVMRRLDHSAIFLVIAGSYTPICLLAMPDGSGRTLLWLAWAAAAAGVGKSILWPTAPKAISAAVYVLIGCMVLPFLQQLVPAIGPGNLAILVTGGVLYVIGAVTYAAKAPNPLPGIFGYHEVFHALVVVASVCHFLVIRQVVLAYPG